MIYIARSGHVVVLLDVLIDDTDSTRQVHYTTAAKGSARRKHKFGDQPPPMPSHGQSPAGRRMGICFCFYDYTYPLM